MYLQVTGLGHMIFGGHYFVCHNYKIIGTYNLGNIVSHFENCVPIPTLFPLTDKKKKKKEEKKKLKQNKKLLLNDPESQSIE